MNRHKIYQTAAIILLLLGGCNLPSSGGKNVFIGPGSDWKDAENWSSGTIPNEGSGRVVIQAGKQVVMSHDHVVVDEFSIENGALVMRSACLEVKDTFVLKLGDLDRNPSCLITRSFTITDVDAVFKIGFDGTIAASRESYGGGHFAHLQADKVHLNGQLSIFFVDDFAPEPGQEFEIISVVDSREGEFANAKEGEIVGGYCDVGMKITYQGGDGNDVTLKAETVKDPDPGWKCSDSHLKPTLVPTASISIDPVTAAVDANCRSGPGTEYSFVSFLGEGDSATVLGRNADGDWVYVQLENSLECWVWGGALTEGSEFSAAVILPDPPTPPAPTATTPPGQSGKPGGSGSGDGGGGGGGDPATASISGTVFGDKPTYGVYDGSDLTLAFFQVHLGAGACDSSGLDSRLTGTNGKYSFLNLEAGTYCLSIDYNPTCGAFSSPSTPTKYTITLDVGESVKKNFGFKEKIC